MRNTQWEFARRDDSVRTSGVGVLSRRSTLARNTARVNNRCGIVERFVIMSLCRLIEVLD